VILSDLWVLKYTWDTEEQIEILAGIIDNIIEKDDQPNAHPQALFNKNPNAEILIEEVETLSKKWDTAQHSFEEQNVLKDKLRYVQSRSKWVNNVTHKQHLETQIEALWQKMLQTI